MQNKKGGFRRNTNLHVTYRETSEAAEASGDAIQPIQWLSGRVTPSCFIPHSPSPRIHFSSHHILSLSHPALSRLSNLRPVDVHVFRARLRFRPLDAEERLIVAPFLSAAFTAVGNLASSEKPGKRTGNRADREERNNRFFGSTCHDRWTSLLARGFSQALDIRSAYFLIRSEEKRWEKSFYVIWEKQDAF